MAVTAPRKPVVNKADRDLDLIDVVEVTRAYLVEHPGERTWSGLLVAATYDDRVIHKMVTRGNLACAYAWNYPHGHPQALPKDCAWFRQGAGDCALLYQQAWRAGDATEEV